MSEHPYLVTCWNCLGEFDAVAAVWCSDDPKNPTKLCPFCLHCFCDASAEYKQQFWRHAPPPLVDELQTLSQSQDRLGDILIRTKKITTPQLLEALIEQRETGRKLGQILVGKGLVSQEDLDAGLRMQGVTRLKDTDGTEGGRVYWEHSDPDSVLDYLLALGARKRASDVSLEPQEEQVAVRYRIDGFSFRVDPIPKAFSAALEKALFAMFNLDPARRGRPLSGTTRARLGEAEYDLILRTVPGPHGVGATIKLVNRSTFIKDVTGHAVDYPLIGDPELKVAKLYDMLPAGSGETSEGRTAADNATVRSVFVIGPDKKVKLQLTYPMTTGRNFDEILRVIDSMQLTAKHQVATPAQWKPGEDVIITPAVSDEDAKARFGSFTAPKPYLRITKQPTS